jgi:hypothetical protein
MSAILDYNSAGGRAPEGSPQAMAAGSYVAILAIPHDSSWRLTSLCSGPQKTYRPDVPPAHVRDTVEQLAVLKNRGGTVVFLKA